MHSQSECLFLLLTTGVRSSSWTTCRCEMFPAIGRGSSPSTAAFSPTSPKGRTATTKLCTDRARRSYEQGISWSGAADETKHSGNMNVIKAQATKQFPHPQLFCLYKEVHLKCARHNNSHSVIFIYSFLSKKHECSLHSRHHSQ